MTLLIVGSLIFDMIFGTSKYPFLTIIVCGIVVLYEIVSPFIYAAR